MQYTITAEFQLSGGNLVREQLSLELGNHIRHLVARILVRHSSVSVLEYLDALGVAIIEVPDPNLVNKIQTEFSCVLDRDEPI